MELEAFHLYLLREKAQQSSTARLNLKLMQKVINASGGLKNVPDYINSLIDSGRNRKYINQHIVVIRYWGECFNIPELKEYPYCKINNNLTYEAAILSDEEIKAFLELPNNGTQPKYRDRYEMWTLFWYIQAYEGTRPGETIRLLKSDIDLGRNVIEVKGKNGTRSIPISFVVRDRLEQYLEVLVGDLLFPPLHSKGNVTYMTQKSWEEDFKRRLARLPHLRRKNLKPYSFRHAAGTRWAEENFSLPKIQKMLGQRRLGTTQKYLHMSLKGVAEMVENDRIALHYKRGIDIMRQQIDNLLAVKRTFRDKLSIKIIEESDDGREITLRLKVLD